MTYRERREARAERLQEWADKRQAKAADSFGKADRIASAIPMGQPILVGHHSEGRHRRDLGRIESGMRQGIEHTRTAERMNEKARNIERQLANSIYSDDDDALEALEARIAALEAERETKKEANKAIRKLLKGVPDDQWGEVLAANGFGAAVSPFWRPGCGMWTVTYDLKNLSGNIKRNRDRLEDVRTRQERSKAADANGGVVVEIIPSATYGDYARVTFAEKPDRSVLDALKAAGFRWSSGSWTGKRDQLPADITTE